MVTITEFSDDVVGSLSGFGQLTDAQIAARTGQRKVTTTAAVKRAQDAAIITRVRKELGPTITADAAAPLHQSDIEQGKTVDQSGNVLDSSGNVIQTSDGQEVRIDGGYGKGPGVTTYKSGGSFIDNLMAAVKANPAIFAAGAALLVVGAIIFLPRLAAMRAGGTKLAPVQTMGLGAGPKRKRKSKSKSRKSKRCPDCGAPGEVRGHQTCQYPQ